MPININTLRRRLMRMITKNIGQSQNPQLPSFPEDYQFKRILVSRPNHRLGNLLLITPLIQEIIHTFPGCQIDLFVKGNLAPIVFEQYENVQQSIRLPKKAFRELPDYFSTWIKLTRKEYDLVLNVDRNSSSGRLSTQWARAELKYFCDSRSDLAEEYPDYSHIAKYPVYNFRRFLSDIGIHHCQGPVPSLDLKLTPAELTKGKNLVEKLVGNNKPTIMIFTYATGRKCYSKQWWQDFYGMLKDSFPKYHVVEVLPAENVSQISFEAPHFYSRDVREIGGFIAQSSVFISADGGIMHLASAAGAPTVGLFSVTRKAVYAPYNTNSFAVDTNETSQEELTRQVGQLLD